MLYTLYQLVIPQIFKIIVLILMILEETNRKFTLLINTLINNLKPASKIYGNVIPRPIRLGAANFHENLQEPKRFVNHLGQAEFIKATTDVTRFVINSSVGVFGIFDVASRISLFSDDTEFDETSAYWGFPVGPYLELPFVGPSSKRIFIYVSGLYIKSNIYYQDQLKELVDYIQCFKYS